MKKDNRSVIQTLTLHFSVWNQYAGAEFFYAVYWECGWEI